MKKDTIIITLLTALAAALLFWHLGGKPLADWDEGLYGNIAGEIARSGNWWQLFLQGQPWLDKEPLGFWLMAASLKIFGFSAWALRLPAAIVSSAIFGLFYALARRRLTSTAATILTTLFFLCPLFWLPHWLRTADLDMPGLAFMLAALVSYFYGRTTRWWWLTGIFLAAGLLTRGAWSGLTLLLILSAEFIRPYYELKRWPWPRFITITTAALAPWLAWHLISWYQNPTAYVQIYWQQQFLARLTSGVDGHAQGPLFYWQFMAAHLGWSLVIILFASVLYVAYLAWRKKDWWLTVLALWFVISFVPAEIMVTKLSWYAALFIAPLWLCAGMVYAKFAPQKIIRRLFLIGALLILTREILFLSVRLQTRPPNFTQQFLQEITPRIPAGAPVVVDGVHTWNQGRLLPAWYWYLHYERGWMTYSIDDSVRAKYLAERANFPWWIVSAETFQKINTAATTTNFSTSTVGSYIFISFPTSTK